MEKSLQPKLRFSEFNEEWNTKHVEEIFHRIKSPVAVEQDLKYKQIGIRSHGKGIFYKDEVTGKELGNKKVFWIEPNVFIVNIVFAWERAIARTTESEIGMIASHRFPMYKPLEGVLSLDFITTLFKTMKGKYYLGLASPGGAGRNKTLGQKEFNQLKLALPSIKEQEKIVSFLSSVDSKIEKLEKKKELLDQYKKGAMQGIFSGGKNTINNDELGINSFRFSPKGTSSLCSGRNDDGTEYPAWEEKKLGDIAKFSKGKNISKADVSENGIECIRYGELYTKYSETISGVISKTELPKDNLILSEIGDILIPASGETAIDLATASCVMKEGVAIGGDINIIKTNENGVFMAYYMNSALKHTIASLAQGISVIHIYNSQLQSLKLNLPCLEEQEKIADFLSSIDKKIDIVGMEIEKNKEFKKGLLQQLFV